MSWLTGDPWLLTGQYCAMIAALASRIIPHKHLITALKTDLFNKHNSFLLFTPPVSMSESQLDAVEWRCVHLPSGYNKPARKYDIISHIVPLFPLWNTIKDLGSIMHTNMMMSGTSLPWIIIVGASRLMLTSLFHPTVRRSLPALLCWWGY